MAVHEPPSDSGDPTPVQEAARRRVNAPAWNLLLILPLVATLFPAFYNSEDPRVGGWPFFYWYQMICIPGSVLLTLIVYRATRGDR